MWGCNSSPDARSFNNGGNRSFNNDDNCSFNNGDNRSFNNDDNRSFNNGDNRSFNHGFCDDFGDAKRPPPNNYIPDVRSIEELYKEDVEHAESYRLIVEDDDDIRISGDNINQFVMMDTWQSAGFDGILLKNVVERSMYIRPRKIQAFVIPVVMEGRDVKGHAETGSGKTAAFMLPIIQMLLRRPRQETKPLSKPSPRAIIIEPTRELCSQVYEQGRKLAYETGIKVAKAYGQYKMHANLNELNAGCDILCATPGRLKHFISANLISVDEVEFLVLDEADTLLEANFLDDIRVIVGAPNFPDMNSRQTMLFSATFPEQVQALSNDVLKPDCVFVSNQKLVAANSRVIQKFEHVQQNDKKHRLLEVLMHEMEEQKKTNPNGPELCRTLVFVRTKRDADLVSLFLVEHQIKASTINGDRSQKLREQALRDFRNNFIHVLVSTDVCARGIDIKDLDHVINMDLPNDAVTYVHRIGRTGRLKMGKATSFFDDTDPVDMNIAKKLVEFVRDVDQEVPDFLQRAIGFGTSHYEQPSSDW